MKMKRNILWLTMASLALPVSTGYAEIYSNHVELGVGRVNQDNGKLGEFIEELEDEGSFVVGSLHLEGGAEDGSYQTFLDFSNNRGEAGYVRPGDFKASVFGSQSQKIAKFETMTLYPGSKTSAPSYLPMPDPDDEYGVRTFKVERHTYGIDMTKYLGSNWSVNMGYSHQKKDGVKTQGNHENDLILPIDVDYEHDQYNLGAEYTGERLSVGANLYYSHFKDRHSSIEYADGDGVNHLIATEPDNKFFQFELDGLYRLGDRTALNWIANWSTAKQDDDFIDSDIAGADLDGKVKRFNGRVTLTSRPFRNFNYKLGYTYYDRHPDQDPIDALPLGYVGFASRDSRVYKKKQRRYQAEAGYRFPDRSKLRVGYEYEKIRRTSDTTMDPDWNKGFPHTTDVNHENLVWAQYKFAPIGKLNMSIKAEHAERDGDQDQFPEWTTPYNADRDHDKYTVNLSYPFNDRLMASAKYSRTDEEFHIRSDWEDDNGNPYGMKSRDIYSAYFDLTLVASEDLTLSAYVMRESYDWKRHGYEVVSGDTNYFTYNSDDDTDAYGITVNWKVNSRLTVDADLSRADSTSDLRAKYDDTALKTIQPQTKQDNIRFNLVGNYQIDKQWSAFVRYIYEDWDVTDWANEGMIDETIGYGWDADDGATNAFIIGARKSF